MWRPKKMSFQLNTGSGIGKPLLLAGYAEEDKVYSVHNNALGQMANKVGIPYQLAHALRDGVDYDEHGWWKQGMLIHMLNEMFAKENLSTSYLRRAVGTEIRGFQGKNFKRTLATAPLLRSFIEECGGHQAGPVEASTTDVRTVIKCVMPHIFEPIKGEYVAFGATFGNSDFGSGKCTVAGTILRANSGTISVLENAFDKMHLGKTLTMDDSIDLEISPETEAKEIAVHQSAIKDVVRSVLSPQAVDKSLKRIVLANSHGIEWYRLRTSLSKVLSKKQLDLVKTLMETGGDLADLPPVSVDKDGDPMATKWWAANVVGWMANTEDDEDKKARMQSLAGDLVAA
jgi:hypothetical protein